MQFIATTTVGAGGAASIDFTGIPATYTDLVLILSARSTSTTSAARMTFNGTGTTYAARVLQADGGTASSYTETTFIGHIVRSDHTNNTFANMRITIPNYGSSVTKTYSIDSATENNSTTAYANLIAGSWTGTSAINQITLTASNFAQYTTATLYGVLKGSGGATVS